MNEWKTLHLFLVEPFCYEFVIECATPGSYVPSILESAVGHAKFDF